MLVPSAAVTLSPLTALPTYSPLAPLARAGAAENPKARAAAVVAAATAAMRRPRRGESGRGVVLIKVRPGVVQGKNRSSPLCRAGARDRKSTRLNSSHVKISYAVF